MASNHASNLEPHPILLPMLLGIGRMCLALSTLADALSPLLDKDGRRKQCLSGEARGAGGAL